MGFNSRQLQQLIRYKDGPMFDEEEEDAEQEDGKKKDNGKFLLAGFVDDPSNHQRAFERVRIRQEVLPALMGEDPRVVEHLPGRGHVAHGHFVQELGLRRDQVAEIAGHLAARPGLVTIIQSRKWTADIAADLKTLADWFDEHLSE